MKHKIGFDLLGNDLGIEPIIEGIKKFLDENDDYQFTLFGPAEEIKRLIDLPDKIVIVNVTEKATMENTTLRHVAQGNSSMNLSLQALKRKEIDAVLSCGDSGLYLANSIFALERLKGVKRPAFMPVFPTIKKGKKFVVLDVGANLETTADMLYEWAFLGKIFAERVLKIPSPRLGLITLGTEEYKGHPWQREANDRLKATFENYLGFIEPRRLMYDIIDVAIVDGYAGNLILKAKEGAMLAFKDLLKKSLTKNIVRKIFALLLRKSFKEATDVLDYRNIGSAFVIGLESLVLKLHGSSGSQAVYSSLNQLKRALECDLIKHYKDALKGQH